MAEKKLNRAAYARKLKARRRKSRTRHRPTCGKAPRRR